MQIWCQFRINFLLKNAADLAPYYGAIWDGFSEER